MTSEERLLEGLLAGVDWPEPASADQGQAGTPSGPGRSSSTAASLVRMALDRYTFGCTSEGLPFAREPSGHVIRPMRGGKVGLRAELARDFYQRENKIASSSALTDAVTTLEGIATNGPVVSAHLRTAECDDAIYIDLGDGDESIILIRAGEWSLIRENVPVLFRRTALTGPFSRPSEEGNLDTLWALINIAPEDRPLVLAFMVSALVQPDVSHAILAMFAEQGSGKSTATRRLVDLLDPSPVPLKKTPRDADTWSLTASSSWVVALDNLSRVPEWLSDSLCRASTGDGDVKRALYTDDGLSIVKFNRCVIANGIDVGAHRGDLAERLVNVELLRIPGSRRRSEKDLNAAWENAKPAVFGAVLDLAAKVHHALPSVELVDHPRMADFARVLAAVDDICGTDGLERYLGRAALSAQDTLSADPFIERILVTLTAPFSGTAAEMLRLCLPEETTWRQPPLWPKNSRAVTSILKRNAPALRLLGWGVEDDAGRNRDGVTKWMLTPPIGGGTYPPGHSN